MTRKRLVVGLTGGIGTGKSSALKVFKALGAKTLSLDAVAKDQAKPGREGYKRIVRDFGSCILKGNGLIDRALLGRVIFSDKRARVGLERVTHPLILKEMKSFIGKQKGIVVVDVPLLFEKKLQKNFDATILIAAKPHKQLKRIINRDGVNSREARLRMKAQMSMAEKRELADVTVHNDLPLARLKNTLREYYLGLDLIHRGLTNGNAD